MALKALAWDFLGLRREDAKQDKKAREDQQQGAVKRYCAPPLGHNLGSKGWNGSEGCNNTEQIDDLKTAEKGSQAKMFGVNYSKTAIRKLFFR